MLPKRGRIWSTLCRLLKVCSPADSQEPHSPTQALNSCSPRSPEYTAFSEMQGPVLDTPEGPILGPNAIVRYVASQGRVPELYPSASRHPIARAQIETWVEFALSTRMLLDIAQHPMPGMKKLDKQWQDIAIAEVFKLVKGVNAHLRIHTLLVGAHVTLAEVVVAAELIDFYTQVRWVQCRMLHA